MATEPVVTLISEGRPYEYHGRRAFEKKTIQIDRLWRVELDGKIIGHIRYVMITRETRSKGKRYVNSRWTSPGYQYQDGDQPMLGIHAGIGRFWFEVTSRKAAIERLVEEAARV